MGETVADIKRRSRERISYLIKRDGLVCRIPGCKYPEIFTEKDYPTVDHKTPKAKGGLDTLDNLQIGHLLCNQRKADRLILEDGTLEPVVRKTKPIKVHKKDPCEECMEGRLLLEGEECPVCEIGPQPVTFPKYLQRRPKDCDHYIHHCFGCVTGLYERKSVKDEEYREDEISGG